MRMIASLAPQAQPTAMPVGGAAGRRPLTHRRVPMPFGAPRGAAPRRILPLPTASGSAALPLPEAQQQGSAPAAPPAEAQQPEGPPPAWLSDAWKEDARHSMRHTFDFNRWRTHRSSSRYLRHVVGIARSHVLQGLAKPLLFVISLSVAVGAYHAAAARGLIPLWPALKVLASTPFNLTSFALSLLLVFRTNASYGRFDEARKLWGNIVNRSRDIVRQGLAFIPPRQAHLQDLLCRWTVAYNRSLLCHLREDEDLEAELQGILHPAEIKALLAASHRPSYCAQVLTAVVRKAQLPGTLDGAAAPATAAVPAGAAYRMDESITVFVDTCGACERLLRTPLPLGYTRHTSRFLMLWLTLLPMSLWGTCGWMTVPIAALVSFLLLGIEEIGVQIEEPFSILPLETICRTIEGNVRELQAMHAAGGPSWATIEAWMEGPAEPALVGADGQQQWGSNVVAMPGQQHGQAQPEPATPVGRPGGRRAVGVTA